MELTHGIYWGEREQKKSTKFSKGAPFRQNRGYGEVSLPGKIYCIVINLNLAAPKILSWIREFPVTEEENEPYSISERNMKKFLRY